VVGGVSNAFDRTPPQVTTLGLGILSTQGTSPFYSQYDMIGQRWFLQLRYEIE